MEMFEYFVDGIKKDRWHDVDDISEKAKLLLERINIVVPTGNTPSMGLPKWSVGLLYNLMSDVMRDTDEMIQIVAELTWRAILRVVFTTSGHYGYYEDINNLLREVFRKEGLTDASLAKNVSLFLILPEDTNYIPKAP